MTAVVGTITVWLSTCSDRAPVLSPVIRPFTSTPLLDDDRRSESRRARLPFSVTLISIRSSAATPVSVSVASMPGPENLNCTVPGGTPVKVNCPAPSTWVVTDVPTTVTVMLVVAIVEMPAADQRSVAMAVDGAALTLLTRPVITAPVVLDARTLVGLAGVTDVLAPSPHAAEMPVATYEQKPDHG